MNIPLFIAIERFDASDGDKWQRYVEWARIPNLVEIVSLDSMLCPRLVRELKVEDWTHIVCENYRLDYFLHLDYLDQRTQATRRRNILGVYRNPTAHIIQSPAPQDFRFLGYDLIEEQTQISALTNCGGFPDVFDNSELNSVGLIEGFDRASEIQRMLAQRHPEEPHAQCVPYAIWRLVETEPLADTGGPRAS
jgi:hypothetical protein